MSDSEERDRLEAFRRDGRDAVDWVAEYWRRIERFPVLSQVHPGEIRAALPPSPPRTGEEVSSMLEDIERLLLPGITHWQSPGFFAYFPSNVSAASVLGELLSAGLGVNGMSWATSPACTELETLVLDWLVEMLDLPRHFHSESDGGGVIQDTASSATLCALIAARERATHGESNRSGVQPGLVAYTSVEAHSSVEKAMRVAGLGDSNLRKIEVDSEFAMRPAALARALEEDRARGRRPFFVCATVGTTSTQAIDPLAEIGELCRRYEAWMHVDAAMAGSAAVCPELRFIHEGLETADSYCFNPHKWMQVNFDCDCFWVKDRSALIGALGIHPEYLRTAQADSGEVIDYRDWQIPLGRRFRSLKLWMTLRALGVEGIQRMIRRHVALTGDFRRWLEDHPSFEVVAPTPLNLVCFRHRAGEEATARLLEALNASGELHVTHTRLAGMLTIRFCIGQATTRRRHVEEAWKQIQQLAMEAEQAS